MDRMKHYYKNEMPDIAKVKDAFIPGLDKAFGGEDDPQFVWIMFDAIESQAFREMHKNPTMLCIYLCRYVCRDENYKAELGLHKNYYSKGLLAASFRLDELTKAFGHKEERTAWEHAQYLAKIRALDIQKTRAPGGRLQNVYVMGKEIDGKPSWYFNTRL